MKFKKEVDLYSTPLRIPLCNFTETFEVISCTCTNELWTILLPVSTVCIRFREYGWLIHSLAIHLSFWPSFYFYLSIFFYLIFIQSFVYPFIIIYSFILAFIYHLVHMSIHCFHSFIYSTIAWYSILPLTLFSPLTLPQSLLVLLFFLLLIMFLFCSLQ